MRSFIKDINLNELKDFFNQKKLSECNGDTPTTHSAIDIKPNNIIKS